MVFGSSEWWQGQVDNENNSQCQDSNISNNILNGILYTESWNRALVRDIRSVRGNTAGNVYMNGRHRMQRWRKWEVRLIPNGHILHHPDASCAAIWLTSKVSSCCAPAPHQQSHLIKRGALLTGLLSWWGGWRGDWRIGEGGFIIAISLPCTSAGLESWKLWGQDQLQHNYRVKGYSPEVMVSSLLIPSSPTRQVPE